jgi:ankyrin repeat protein
MIAALVLSLALAATGASPVADAAMQGDVATIRTLLKQGSDVNAAQGDGMTALHWAAMQNNAELAQILLYAGANVRATTRINGYTPLFLASQHGHAEVIDTLLKGGADARAISVTGSTPLMLAAASGNIKAVQLLLDAGADVNARDTAKGHTALMYATGYNRVPVVRLLTGRGADVTIASKVVDLYEFSAEDSEGRPAQGQAPSAGATQAQQEPRPVQPSGAPATGGGGAQRQAPRRPQVPGVDRGWVYTELIGYQGGLTPLLLAAREGHNEAVKALLEAGADVNQVSPGDKTSALLIATINGHYDLARSLLDQGADPKLASENGVTPLYAVLNCEWAQKANYPQPRAHLQQRLTYLDLMTALLDKGADPNTRLRKKVWYAGYNSDLSGIDESGATPFWRAAYASDVPAMKLLVARGADSRIPTMKPAGRRFAEGAREAAKDVSGLPPIPVGGPSVNALMAAAGLGYAEGFAANSHRIHPAGWMPAIKYLVEELGLDVNARDHEGNTALHHAASRGDNEMIQYLLSKGADLKAINREGQNVADMANGPVQRTQPYPETLALLEKLGLKHNNKCVSC